VSICVQNLGEKLRRLLPRRAFDHTPLRRGTRASIVRPFPSNSFSPPPQLADPFGRNLSHFYFSLHACAPVKTEAPAPFFFFFSAFGPATLETVQRRNASALPLPAAPVVNKVDQH